MKKERRELEDWEKQECAALKAAIADFNAGKPREKRVTQEELAHELKMSQGTLNSHLNGGRPLNKEMAAKIYMFMGIPASRYSKRLADELQDIAKAVPLSEVITVTELSGFDPPALAPSPSKVEATLLDAITAVHAVQASILDGSISRSQLARLLAVRDELSKGSLNAGDPPAFPRDQLQGILEAAFRNAESGQNPDDLVAMFKHGMNKNRKKEADKNGEPTSSKRAK